MSDLSFAISLRTLLQSILMDLNAPSDPVNLADPANPSIPIPAQTQKKFKFASEISKEATVAQVGEKFMDPYHTPYLVPVSANSAQINQPLYACLSGQAKATIDEQLEVTTLLNSCAEGDIPNSSASLQLFGSPHQY
jgi:hypothetical protein